MATSFRQDDPLSGYVPMVDVNNFTQGLLYMQGQYDKNVAQMTALDRKLKEIADSQIINPQAKEYFYQRMRDRKTQIERNAGNFAFQGELEPAMTELLGSMDSKVQNEIKGSSVYPKILSQAEKEKEKGAKGAFSQLNLEYSLQDVSSWANNTKREVGEAFTGNSGYIPYVDKLKRMTDIAKAIEPDAYAVSTPNGGYEIRNKNGTYLAGSRVMQAVEFAIAADGNLKKQIEVDAWGQYRGIKDNNEFKEGAIKELDAIISSYESTYSNEEKYALGHAALGDNDSLNKSKQSLSYLGTKVNELRAKRKSLGGATSLDDENRRVFESLLMEENFKNSAANTFAYNKVTKNEIDINEAAYRMDTHNLNIKEYNNKIAQQNITNAQNQEKIDIDKYKALKEANGGAEPSVEQMKGIGITSSGVLSMSSALDPNLTKLNTKDIEKTDTDEAFDAKLEARSASNIAEMGGIASKIALLNNDENGARQAKLLFSGKDKQGNSFKTQAEANNAMKQYYQGLQDQLLSLEGKKGSDEVIDLINQFNKLAGRQKKYGIYKEKIKTKDSTPKGQEEQLMELSNQFEYGVLGAVAQDLYHMAFPKFVNKQKLKIAKEVGIGIYANEDIDITSRDAAILGQALKFTDDADLQKYGYSNPKELKEMINKSLTTKDAEAFPIQGVRFKNGEAYLLKGEKEIPLTGVPAYSKLGQTLEIIKQNQVQSIENLNNSIELVADVRSGDPDRNQPKLVNLGKNGIGKIKINTDGKNLMVVVSAPNLQTGAMEDIAIPTANGTSFIPIPDEDGQMGNISPQIESIIKAAEQRLKQVYGVK